MRIPDGTATVCAEAPTFDESRSLEKSEKAVWALRMRKSGELLKCGKNTRICKYGFCGFLLRKNGCSNSLTGCCSFFAVTVCAGLVPLDLRIALAVTARKPTEYCFIGKARRSGQNPEQPSIAVFGICHKSESLLYRSGLSRFDRRVQPNLSVLADKLVVLFLRIDHKEVKEGCK